MALGRGASCSWAGGASEDGGRRYRPQRAVSEVASNQYRGLTFHQLRHSCGTWLVSDGVPINDMQRLMGPEKASTTLNLYVHHQKTLDSRVTELFDDFLMTPDPEDDSKSEGEDGGDGA